MAACVAVLFVSLSPLLAAETDPSPLPECEWCGAGEAPPDLSHAATLAGPDEPGERLVLSGTVFGADGKTPVPGVLIYAYHTNAGGVYPKRGDEKGNARRHGYLRGWVRTDEAGRYRFDTIRPGVYPTRTEPAHIHMTVTPPGREERWIDSVEFEDDPLLTESHRRRLPGRGGSGIVRLAPDGSGGWTASRDIILERKP